MNRLTSATAPAPIPNQPAGGSGALAYGYDWVGNRIHPPSGSNAMVYNTADQLSSWPGMRHYTYYPDGSLQHVTNAGGTSTLASYAYTPTGLLSQATKHACIRRPAISGLACPRFSLAIATA